MQPDVRSLERALLWHCSVHGPLPPAEAVKLLFQAVLGMDHLLADRKAFARALEREWEALAGPYPQERLLEPVHPGRKIVRINLRVAKGFAISADELATFLAEQPLVKGSRDELEAAAHWSVGAARRGRIPITADSLEPEWRRALDHGHPPHHSPNYRQRARPAYRLVHNAADERFLELVRMMAKRRA